MSRIASGSWAVALASGLGIGWLAGLSVSPIATVLISSLLGTVGIAAAFNFEGFYKGAFALFDKRIEYWGRKKGAVSSDNRTIDIGAGLEINERTPKAATSGVALTLILGICFGTALGILTRTNEWLGAKEWLWSPPQLAEPYSWMRFNVEPQNVSATSFESEIAKEIDFWARARLGLGQSEEVSQKGEISLINNSNQSSTTALANERKEVARVLFDSYYKLTSEPQNPSNIPDVANGEMAGATESVNGSITSSTPALASGSLIDSSDCDELRSLHLNPAALSGFAESLRETPKAGITEDTFSPLYFKDPTIFAGALLWECQRPKE